MAQIDRSVTTLGPPRAPMERRLRQRRERSKAPGIHAVPDDLLRLILLRLDSPLWLLRAACAWRRFRDLVGGGDGGGTFLRHARSLHPPAVVGHYDDRGSGCRKITFVMHSSPPVRIDGGRFSLDFLPRVHIETGNWAIADCHGGLVLLRECSRSIPNLIVCDPLTRRYRRIYHPPGERAVYDNRSVTFSRTFLLDGGDGSISMSNFRVLYRSNRGPRGCVFSTADGVDYDWCSLTQSARDDDDGCKGDIAGRIDGSLYLGLETGSVIVLDNASLEFSQVDLPIHVDTSEHSKYHSTFRVVHGAGAGDPTSPPPTWIVHVRGQELECFRLLRGTGEWMLEHSIPLLDKVPGLPAGLPKHKVEVIADGTGTAVLLACGRWVFSVNLYTMELQGLAPKEAAVYRYTRTTFNYTLPWPQFLRPIYI